MGEVSNKQNKNFRRWLLPIIFIVVGVVVLIIGINYAKESLDSLRWSSVGGKVVSSEIAQSVSGRGEKRIINYDFKINYIYVVDGQEYSGWRVKFFNLGTGFKGYLKNVQNEYCVDQDIKVFYDPQNPKEAVLEPGIQIENAFFFVIGLMFVLGGGAILLLMVKNFKLRKFLKCFLVFQLFASRR